MKKVIVLLGLVGLLLGCSGFTKTIYGPDMTPAQLSDAVYADAYAIGQIRASDADADIPALVAEANKVRGYANPRGYLTAQFLESLREGDEQGAILYFAARRLYDKIGATLIHNKLITDNVDVDLFMWAVDAYIKGLQGLP